MQFSQPKRGKPLANWPAGQCSQVLFVPLTLLYEPAPHAVQLPACSSTEKYPGSQTSHTVVAFSSWSAYPATHASQLVAFEPEYFPAGHWGQNEPPGPGLYQPDGHMTQGASPLPPALPALHDTHGVDEL